MIHGHCHGKSRSNKIQILKELRVDVGIDGNLAKLRFNIFRKNFQIILIKYERT